MNYKESECSCTKCKTMCLQAPCLGTPEEMEALMNAGYKDYLIPSNYDLDKKVPLIMPGSTHYSPSGRCVFLSGEKLCRLHQTGLKPLEGRLANCKDEGTGTIKRELVVKTWDSDKGREVIEKYCNP